MIKSNDAAYSFVNNYVSPHTGIFDGFKQKTISDFQAIRNYIRQQITGEVEDEAPEEIQTYISQEIREDEQDRRLEEEQAAANNRNLAGSCVNGGVSTTAKVNVYTCSGVQVSKSTYTALNGANCTVSTGVTKSVCYCSFEFYGDNCQTFNTYSLEVARMNYLGDCTGPDTFNYVYSYNGVPPCYSVSEGQSIIMINKIVGQTADSSYNFEGVKPSVYEVVTQPNLGSNVFTYVVNTDNFKLTARGMPITPYLKITFMNWLRFSSPVVILTSLTAAHIAGIANVTTQITFDSVLAPLAYSGRYYYELSVTANNQAYTISQGYYGAYFEQAGYVEPPGKKPVNVGLIVGLSVFGVILLIGLFIGYKLYKITKVQPQQESEAECDPLMVYAAQEDGPSPIPNLTNTPVTSRL